jgi:hypothetical protein
MEKKLFLTPDKHKNEPLYHIQSTATNINDIRQQEHSQEDV